MVIQNVNRMYQILRKNYNKWSTLYNRIQFYFIHFYLIFKYFQNNKNDTKINFFVFLKKCEAIQFDNFQFYVSTLFTWFVAFGMPVRIQNKSSVRYLLWCNVNVFIYWVIIKRDKNEEEKCVCFMRINPQRKLKQTSYNKNV